MKRIVGFILLLSLSSLGQSQPLCKGIALEDTHTTDGDGTAITKKGEKFEHITQFRVEKGGKISCFCEKGGYCWDAKHIKLINCKIGSRIGGPGISKDEKWYSIEIIRSRTPPEDLKHGDISGRLIELGMCTACASNAAEFYLKLPKSKCGSLVKEALEGNPEATQELTSGYPHFCE